MGWEEIAGHYDFQDIYAQAVKEAPQGATLVEVGVMFGRSIAHLCELAKDRPDIRIVGVDCWRTSNPNVPWGDALDKTQNPEGWGGVGYVSQIAAAGGPFSFFTKTMQRHAPEAFERVDYLRVSSVEAARMFRDNSLDFVFIDADHRYKAVKADLEAWWPKVKHGGVMAGHDFNNYPENVGLAVREFFPEFTIRGGSWWVRI